MSEQNAKDLQQELVKAHFDVAALTDKINILEELVAAKDEYIKLLGEELKDLIPVASIHGWQSHRVAVGQAARAKIVEIMNRLE
jgi:hypothetical protein